MRNDLQNAPGNAGPHILFDDGGQLFTLIDGNQGALLQSILLGPTGLAVGAFFEVPGTEVGDGPFDIVQNEVFTALGSVIDLANQTGDARYDTRAPSFDDQRGGVAVNADIASGDVFIFVGAGGPGSGLGRYDYGSGTLTAEQYLLQSPFGISENSLLDIGPDRLGIVMGRNSGLVILDKAHIQ
jgi:hypothetical protein